MGEFKTVGRFVDATGVVHDGYADSAGGVQINKAFLDVMRQAAAASPFNVVAFSGVQSRSAGSTNHPGGYAMDIFLQDPKTGEFLTNYDRPGFQYKGTWQQNFRAYEQFAQTAKSIADKTQPGISKYFVWGGYFYPGRANNAPDLMHFDVNPNATGNPSIFGEGRLRGNTFAKGATPAFQKRFGIASNGGLDSHPELASAMASIRAERPLGGDRAVVPTVSPALLPKAIAPPPQPQPDSRKPLADGYNHVGDAQRTAMSALPPASAAAPAFTLPRPVAIHPMFDPNERPSGRVASDPAFALLNLPNPSGFDVTGNPIVPPVAFGTAPNPVTDHFVQPQAGPAPQPAPAGSLAPTPKAGAGGSLPLSAINTVASPQQSAAPGPLLGYAGGAPSGGFPAHPSLTDLYVGGEVPTTSGGYGDQFARPGMPQPQVTAMYPGYGHPYDPGMVALAHYGSPGSSVMGQYQPPSYNGTPGNSPSSFIPKYIPVTHHVLNPAYVAQFGAVDPPMPDFMSMVALRLGARLKGQAGNPVADPSPPPPPPGPPNIFDPESIRATLIPALQALERKRSLEAANGGAGLTSTG